MRRPFRPSFHRDSKEYCGSVFLVFTGIARREVMFAPSFHRDSKESVISKA